MAENRVSQIAVESLVIPAHNARLSQLAVETTTTSAPNARLSQFVMEVIVRPGADFLGAGHGDRPFVY